MAPRIRRRKIKSVLIKYLKITGWIISGLVLFLLVLIILPINIPGIEKLKQMAATTAVSLSVLPPTPLVTSIDQTEGAGGQTINTTIIGENFQYNYGDEADPWSIPFVQKALLQHGDEKIVGEHLAIIDESHLTATFNISSVATPGNWDVTLISDENNNVQGTLKDGFRITQAVANNNNDAANQRNAAAANPGGGGGSGGIMLQSNSDPNIIYDSGTSHAISQAFDYGYNSQEHMSVALALPANSVPNNTRVAITEIRTPKILPQNTQATILGIVAEVKVLALATNQEINSFNKKNITLSFNLPELLRLPPSLQTQIGLYYLDEVNNLWIRIPASLNSTFMIAELNHLTKFGLFKTQEGLAVISVGNSKKITFNRNLKIGMSGPDVRALQNILITEKLLDSSITGYFGKLTENAVKKYQKKLGITPQSGLVGPKTIAALNKTSFTTFVVQTLHPPFLKVPTAPENNNIQNALDKIRSLLLSIISQAHPTN